jgi:hypothetical protein
VVNKTLHILTIVLFSGFIGFLLFASSKAGLNFDSSYNLLSYQSLFNGTGFVYEYDGKKIPFDPVISTGPELYLPAFFIWKLIGHTSYHTAVFVTAAYFIAFLLFFIFGVLKDARQRFVALFAFLVWFFANGKNFGISSNLFIDPLGEVLATCLVFAGFYLLNEKKMFFGFLLFGFALDTKPNIIIALIPTVAIFIFQKLLFPEWKRKKYRALFQKGIRVIPVSLLMFLPYLFYSKIAPVWALPDHEKKIFQQARDERNVHMMNHGFGQAIDLYKNFTPDGIGVFLGKTEYKIERIRSFFDKSYFLAALFGFFLALLLILSRRHWSFYLFLFSTFFLSWWLFMSRNTWYRYFFVSEFITILGVGAFLPSLIANKKRYVLILLLVVFAGFSLPRFSIDSLKQSLNGEEKENMMLMKETIGQIDEKKIFTFGFLQCPQIMFLTNKRFQDFFNKKKLEEAKKDEAYFLTTYENILLTHGELDTITKDSDLIASYGYNKLYRIK